MTIFAALAALALASSAVAREEGNSRSVAGSRVAGNGSTGHRDMRDGAGGRVRIHPRTLTLSHVYLARRDTSEVRIQRGRRRRRAAVLDEGGLRRQQTALRANILQLGNVENRDTVFPWDQKPNYDLPGECLPCASRNKLRGTDNLAFSAVGDLAVTMTCIAFMYGKSVRSSYEIKQIDHMSFHPLKTHFSFLKTRFFFKYRDNERSGGANLAEGRRASGRRRSRP